MTIREEIEARALNFYKKGNIWTWITRAQTYLDEGKMHPKRRAVLRALVAKYKRKYKPKPLSKARRAEIARRSRLRKSIILIKVKMYPAGARSNSGKSASKGRRVSMMPFGTWYYV